MENYLKLGYSKEWTNQRLKNIEVKDAWQMGGIPGILKKEHLLYSSILLPKHGAVKA